VTRDALARGSLSVNLWKELASSLQFPHLTEPDPDQFGIDPDGKCGATLTYPIKGLRWRRNLMKHYAFHLSEEETALLFAEVRRLRAEHPQECLPNDQLWSDSSEKANGITRDRRTGTLCHTIGISGDDGQSEEQFAMREDSDALLTSSLYRTISRLIGPHEKQDEEDR
jgi:hypothetical protein